MKFELKVYFPDHWYTIHEDINYLGYAPERLQALLTCFLKQNEGSKEKHFAKWLGIKTQYLNNYLKGTSPTISILKSMPIKWAIGTGEPYELSMKGLNEVIKERGYSIRKLERESGYSRLRIAALQNGDVNPEAISASNWLRLAKALNCSFIIRKEK